METGEEDIMRLNSKGLGLAFGVAGAFFYLGCVLIMAIAGPEVLVLFFNGLLHGLDVTPVLQLEVGFWVSVIGLVNTFVIGWLFGALIAVVYNGAVSRVVVRR